MNSKKKRIHTALFLFFLAFAVNILIKYILFPSLTIKPEVFAESGTNFFINGYYNNIWTNIITVDAGYLPWMQRIIAVFATKVIQDISFYPYITQWSAIFFISLFSSIIVLPVFRRLIPFDSVRFLLAIGISMISDYELNSFINFVYFGSIFTFLMIFVNKEEMKTIYVLLLALLTGIIFCSKGVFVVFIPVYFLLFLFYLAKKEYRSVMYYSVSIFFGAIQILTMISHTTSSQSQSHGLFTLVLYVLKTFYYLLLTYRHVLIGTFTTDKGYLLGMIFVVIILFFGIKKIWNKKNNYLLTFILIGNILAFGSLFLTVVLVRSNTSVFTSPTSRSLSAQKSVSLPNSKTQNQQFTLQIDKSVFFVKHFANLRNMFVSNVIIFLAAVVIILTLFDKKSHQLLVLGIIIYSSGAFGQFSVEEPYRQQLQSFSQWQTYVALLKRPNYCIPLNHYPFIISKNCNYLFPLDPEKYIPSSKTVNQINLIKIDSKAKDWKIESVVIVNNNKQFTDKNTMLYAYDENGEILTKTKQLTPSDYNYVYFLFDIPRSGVSRLIWKDSNNKTIMVSPNILVFGTR